MKFSWTPSGTLHSIADALQFQATRSYFRYLRYLIWKSLGLQHGLLVYVGANYGHSLERMIHKYSNVIAIEANPSLAEHCKHKFSRYSNTEVHSFAASDRDGHGILKLPSDSPFDGAATLDAFSTNRKIRQIGEIRVETRNLGKFLTQLGIDQIRSYVSDCEGYDLKILKSLTAYLSSGALREIQCEVQIDGTPPAYLGVQNFETDFDELLASSHQKVGRGWGLVRNGIFKSPPKGWSFYDVKWRLRGGVF